VCNVLTIIKLCLIFHVTRQTYSINNFFLKESNNVSIFFTKSYIKKQINSPVSISQLIETLHYICIVEILTINFSYIHIRNFSHYLLEKKTVKNSKMSHNYGLNVYFLFGCKKPIM